MSKDQPLGGDLEGLGAKATEWLRDVADRRRPARGTVSQTAGVAAEELLRRAAQCYARDGWAQDACRLFARLGDDRSAAPYFEQTGHWRQAAACYVRTGQWRNAARCWMQCGEPAEAAECLVKAEEPLEAAWLLAHGAGHFIRARSVLEQVAGDTEADRLAVRLVTARCEAGTGRPSPAAGTLRDVACRLRQLPAEQGRSRAFVWAQALAEALRRPDLAATLHAAAFEAGMPDARRQWENWAEEALGDQTGIPDAGDERPESPEQEGLA